MSERYTIVDSKHGLTERIRDNASGELFILHGAATRLNRLAAEVATLRDIVQVCRFQPIDPRLIERIDAALAQSGETP